MHNRNASNFIYSVRDARIWSESKLAKESGIARSVVCAQLSGTRKIRPNHLVKYLAVLNHQERPGLLAAWLRDMLPQDQVQDLLNVTGDNLGLDVTTWVPTLDEDNKRMLDWWAREMSRDGELQDLFHLLSARAGYTHPKGTAAGPVKKRKRRR